MTLQTINYDDFVDLKRGSKGNNVTLLQKALTEWKYYAGKVNGEFGPITEESVKKFRKAVGLSESGVFDKDALAKFDEKIKGKPSVVSTTTATPAPPIVTRRELPKNFGVDLSRNVFSYAESNISIDGLRFPASSIEPGTAFNNGNWKTIDLMDGSFTYLGHRQKLTWTVEIYMSRANFDILKNEFFKMGNRVCEVLSSELDSGKYTVGVAYATSKGTWKKVTLTLTEY